MATNRLSERGMIEATIRSINKTIAFQLARPDGAGEYAAATAMRLRDQSQAKLDALDAQRKERIAA